MLPLKLKAESLMSSMDSVLLGIQLVFNESNRNNLAESFSSVNQTLNNLESTSLFLNDYVKVESKKITSVLSRIDTLSLGLLTKTADLQDFITNMNRFSDTLANIPLVETFSSFREVIDNLHQLTLRISAGEGSLGKLVMDDSLFNGLLATNASLDRLIEDIRIHPGRYVRLTLSDKSRFVYAANDSELAQELAGEGTSDYYISQMQSGVLLDPDDPALKGQNAHQFIQIGSVYYYYVFENKRIEPCLKKLAKLRKLYPSAGIFTWVNGVWKRLSI
jgi:phospholipid/cholesterol/gamma-HCH transport system substrate-binding protein